MPIADRMSNIDSSGIRKAFELARTLEDPVNLSIGQPDFGPPEEMKRRAIEAIEAGAHRYTLTQGIPELREEIRAHLAEARGIEPEEVMVTSGVAGGIMLSFLVLVNPGEEVAIPDPYFVIYKHLCHMVGAVPRFIDTYPDFLLTPERLERALGKRTKLVVLNNPANPTGALLPPETLAELAEVAGKHGAVVLSDEIYDFFVYEGRYKSIARFLPSAVVLGGYSKAFGVPGWRVGYAAGPRRIIDEMIKLQQYSFVCAPSVLQYGVLGALGLERGDLLEEYRRKRDLLCAGLRDRYEFNVPGGAFYLFPRAPGGDGDAFVRRAVEKGLIVVPGSVFSERGTHFRISYAAPENVIERGIAILNELA